MIGWFRCFHLPLGIPAEVVYDISEVCAPFVDADEVSPLVSASYKCYSILLFVSKIKILSNYARAEAKNYQVRIQCLYILLNVCFVDTLCY